MAMAEVPTVFMICENMSGPDAYNIYAINPSDHHNNHESSSRSSRPRSRHRSHYRHRSRSRYCSRCNCSRCRSCYSRRPRSIPIPSPVYRMKRELYPFGMGFFSIGSKIYMIGGEEFKDDESLNEFNDNDRLDTSKSNRVYVYDTITSRVKRGPPMVSGKSHPIAIGPIDGKFYVLSYNLCLHDFELFDPESRTWLQLPPPPFVPWFRESGFPPQEYDIEAHVAVGHTILLSTNSGSVFSFHVITHTWCEIKNSKKKILPFLGSAVIADDGRCYALSDDFDKEYDLDDDDFAMYAFRVLHHPYLFVEAPVKKLKPPTGPICCIQRQGYVNYLGNKHLCC